MTNFQYFGEPKWIFKFFFLNIGIYEYKKKLSLSHLKEEYLLDMIEL